MNTLQQDLDAFKVEWTAKRPKETIALMEKADLQLAATDILQKALKAGDKAPDFTLFDAMRRKVSLSDTLEQGPVILVFYRGGWCPYCNLELRSYQRYLPEICKAGAQLIAISPQSPDTSLSTQEKNALVFPVLSDTENEVAEAFGIVFDLPDYLTKVYASFSIDLLEINDADRWALPLPATYVIGQDSTILKSFVETDYRIRMEPTEALAVITNLKKEEITQ